jgi:hypothetical protein
MYNFNIRDILKVADELGIEYEMNSATPGMFIVDGKGKKKEATFEEIFMFGEETIDDTITRAISSMSVITKKSLQIENKYFNFQQLDGVA